MPSISPLIARVFDDTQSRRTRRERDTERTRNGYRRKAKRDAQ
jgi:hypothetical protein